MADLAAVAASEHIYPLGSGVVLYIGRVNVAADADTYTLPTGTIISVQATWRDSAVAETDVPPGLTWATNVITFNDPTAATVEIWAICEEV